MNKKFFKASLILLFVLSLTSMSMAQRQTGSIHGTVIDDQGNILPGANVTLSGPALLGTRNYVASEAGKFRFPALLPGMYEVKVEMPGFKTKTTTDIKVNVGKTTTLTITLEVTTIEEAITVTAEEPMVDVESAKLSISYGADFIASIPMNKDLYDIQNSIPGAISEGVWYRRTSSILGGTVRSQLYALDGVSMNDPATTYSMVNINVEVYEEIEFEVGAHLAEVGQTDSTYINIVTKSGGNKFSGGGTIYYTGESLSKNMFADEQIEAFGVDAPEKFSDYKDGSLNLGGPLIKDRLWFFINGRRQTWDQVYPGIPDKRMQQIEDAVPGTFTQEQLQHYDLEHREWMGFAKLTFQLSKNIKYMGMVHYNHIYEPIYSNEVGNTISWEATQIWDHENSYVTSHQFNWILDQNTFLDIRGNYVYRYFPLLAHPETAGNYYNYDYTTQVYWGTTEYIDEYWRRKLAATASLTRFQDQFLGSSHEFKAGVEYEHTEYDRDWYRLGNPYYTYWRNYVQFLETGDPRSKYYHSVSGRRGRIRLRACPDGPGQWLVQDHTNRFSGYVQDSVTTGKLALNLGVRLDYSYQYEPDQSRPELRYDYPPEFQNPAITDPNAILDYLIADEHAKGYSTRFDATTVPYYRCVEFTTFSPRIGIVYDIFGDGQTALKLSYARYYEPVWSAKYNAANLFGAQTQIWYWYDDNRNGYMDLPPDDHYSITSRKIQDITFRYYKTWESIQKFWQTGNPEDLEDGLKTPYMDEITAGIEHELVKDFKLGLQFVWKQNRNIVESVDMNNGYDKDRTDETGPIWIPYNVIDPGWDGEFGTADDKPLTVYGLREDREEPIYIGTNPPDAKRDYWALIFTFDKRMSNKWQLKGSLLYSSFKGNCRAGYGYTEGEESYFNDPNTLINNYGPLWFDRPLQIKIMGTVVLPYNFILSAYLQSRSGSALTREFDRVYFPSSIEYQGNTYEVQQSYVSVLAEPRGSMRSSSYTNLDLRLEKDFALGGYGKVSLYIDVFNVAGRSDVSINSDPFARLYYYEDPPEYELSSTYGQITSVSGVRSMRLGLRWSF